MNYWHGPRPDGQTDRRVKMNKEQIAKVCHEVNRAYCLALGDNSQVPWDDAPDWQKESAALGVDLHINNPEAGPEASHVSWMNQKLADGWVWGPYKDAAAKTHHCIVSFSELPPEQQAKDFIFRAVVHALAEAVKYGCHCDIESMGDDFVPDGCVIDSGRFHECIYAEPGMVKEQCIYWKAIDIYRDGRA